MWSAAGGKDRAVQRTYSAQVTDGQLNIAFTAQTDVPAINAIEIAGVPVAGTPPSSGNWETSYSYDAKRQLTGVTMMTRGAVSSTGFSFLSSFASGGVTVTVTSLLA